MIALAAGCIACGDVERCLDRGGSYNYQVGQCDFVRSQPGPGSPCLHDIIGVWRVSGHKAPGISAMSSAEADAWVGEHATYETSKVMFHSARCDRPSFASRVVSARSFVEQFRIPPEDLGLSTSGVCITTIGCPEEWTAPGSLLLHSPHALITLWDGVFFELERD